MAMLNNQRVFPMIFPRITNGLYSDPGPPPGSMEASQPAPVRTQKQETTVTIGISGDYSRI